MLSVAEIRGLFAEPGRGHLRPKSFNILWSLVCEAVELQDVVQVFGRWHGGAETRDKPAA